MVVDPSVHQPEISSFNHISSLTDIRCTYHLPALTNEKSIDDELVNSIINLSIPIPAPAVGGIPYSKALIKSSS